MFLLDVLPYLYWSLFISYFIFILFLWIGFFRIPYRAVNNKLKASVIVPFRNESHNLVKCIKSILNQDIERDRFEIILIDDHSSDDYFDRIKNMIKDNEIKLIKLNELEGKFGKKKAIAEGIKNSTNEIIVTTDADCWHDKKWLKSLLESFDENTGFVAGKIVYFNGKNFFEILQKIEFTSLVAIGASLIGNNYPLLANGATCAYRKELYYKLGGFDDNIHLASGDEEFLMQKIWRETNYKVRFCFLPESTTYTLPIESIGKFINQRKRWVSKVPFYKNKFLLSILILLYLFYLSLLVNLLIAIIFGLYVKSLFFIYVIKTIIDSTFLINGFNFLGVTKNVKEKLKLIILIPIAELFHLFYITLVPIAGVFTGFNWKGRELKR